MSYTSAQLRTSRPKEAANRRSGSRWALAQLRRYVQVVSHPLTQMCEVGALAHKNAQRYLRSSSQIEDQSVDKVDLGAERTRRRSSPQSIT
jgi:hypothetical protein